MAWFIPWKTVLSPILYQHNNIMIQAHKNIHAKNDIGCQL